MSDLTTEQQADLAAWMFPRAWADAKAISVGDRRRRRLASLRQRAAPAFRVAELKRDGATCSTCRHITGSVGGVKGPICDFYSDSAGYVRTYRENLCHSWEARA